MAEQTQQSGDPGIITSKIEPNTTGVDHDNPTKLVKGEASGDTKGKLVWQKRRTPRMQPTINPRDEKARYTHRAKYDLTELLAGDTQRQEFNIYDFINGNTSLLSRYEYFCVEGFTVTFQSDNNWLKGKDALVMSYKHDIDRTFSYNPDDKGRYCDSWLVRLTHHNEIKVPVRCGKFYCKKIPNHERFTSPGSLHFFRRPTRALGDRPVNKYLCTISFDILCIKPTIIFPKLRTIRKPVSFTGQGNYRLIKRNYHYFLAYDITATEALSLDASVEISGTALIRYDLDTGTTVFTLSQSYTTFEVYARGNAYTAEMLLQNVNPYIGGELPTVNNVEFASSGIWFQVTTAEI